VCQCRPELQVLEQPIKQWKVVLRPPKVSVTPLLLRKLEEGVKEQRFEVAMAAARELEDWGRRCDDDSGNQVAQTVAQKLRHGLILSVKSGEASVAEALVRALGAFLGRFEAAKPSGELAIQRLVYIFDDSILKGHFNVVAAAASALLGFSDCPSLHVSHAIFGLLRVLQESVQSGKAVEATMAVTTIQKLARANASMVQRSTGAGPCKASEQVVDSLLAAIEDGLKLDGGNFAEVAASALVEIMNEWVVVLMEPMAHKLMSMWKRASQQGAAEELHGILLRIATRMSSLWYATSTPEQ